MKQRFRQLQALPDMSQKWIGWHQTLVSAHILPNFTEFGWGLTQAPQALTDELRTEIYAELPYSQVEQYVKVVNSSLPSMFIERNDLATKASRELQPILEAWAGMELVPSIAYGFRIYRHGARLWMHLDQLKTHVISCIYHIASANDAKPWPLLIEDYDGNTMAVVLKPGDMLLYESAKNFHGRPIALDGNWYSSLFLHYYPKMDGWVDQDHKQEVVNSFPPDWREVLDTPSPYPPLEMIGGSMYEPDCPDYWCHVRDAIYLEGPGEYGKVLTSRGKRYSLFEDSLDANAKEEL